MRVQRITQSGHSLCVVMPREYLLAIGLRRGDYVVLRLEDKRIVVEALERVERRVRSVTARSRREITHG